MLEALYMKNARKKKWRPLPFQLICLHLNLLAIKAKNRLANIISLL
ncbi:hypothetical protein NEOC65_000071 [Neochlamydia sp. AcF65]|nr:hypothetical protein [Neochlamydia sp. AcF65]